MSSSAKKSCSSSINVDFPTTLLPRNVSVTSVLANGMFSTVYKAVLKIPDTPSSTAATNTCEMPFVIKHIKSSNHPKRVLTEMCLLAKLRGRHNIIPVWSLISFNFSYLVIMPHFTHDSFSSFFRDLTRREVANYLYALLDALAYIHALNVTHRDIKPTNFLYDRQTKRFALIDFGLAEKESRSCMALSKNNAFAGDTDTSKPPLLQCAVERTDSISLEDSASKPGTDQKREIAKGGTENVYPTDELSRLRLSGNRDALPADKSAGGDLISPQVPTLFALGKVTTVKPKTRLCAANIRRRLRFSDVLNVEGDEGHQTKIEENIVAVQMDVTASSKPTDAGTDTKTSEVVNPQPPAGFARFKSSDSGYSTASSLHSTPSGCRCDGPSLICGQCQQAPEIQAQRSGTTGYRAPEVLLRSRSQTTAIDVWAAGVVFLIILTGRYPFFTAKVDLEAVCQLMTIFGRRKIAELANELGLLLLLPSNCPISEEAPISLGDLCKQLRAGVPSRRLFGMYNSENQSSSLRSKRKRTYGQADLTRSPIAGLDNAVATEFATLAFDLLEKLLELRPSCRITAADAMKHQFFVKFSDLQI